MKSEKRMRLLLLLCGHALVGAELRGTVARMGDPELNNKAVKSYLGADTNSIPNTRTLQSALCGDYKACVWVFGGPNLIPTDAKCCPGADGIIMNCCGDMSEEDRYDPPNFGDPTIPFPTSTTPTSTTPTPTTPKVDTDASCSAYPACVELFGGPDKVMPGSLCCPTPYGQRMTCCDETRVDPPTDGPTIPVPTTTTPPPATSKVDASCSAHPACVELFGGPDKVMPGSMCCPTPYGQRMDCCGP